MQQKHNVWGRELRSAEEASDRAMKALRDNPKIQNLHVATIVYEPGPSDARRRVFYQARWYDSAIRVLKLRSPKECPTCGCECR